MSELSATPKTYPRPLSPHLQIYRPQLTSMLSILHRGSGIVLYFGIVLLAWGLFVLATDPAGFLQIQEFMATVIGRIMAFGWTFCLFYHLCNGIRHLVWDAGKGFELREVYDSGGMVIVGSVLLTTLAWVLAYALHNPETFQIF